LTAGDDQVPADCVVSFDNIHTLPRTAFRRRITCLSLQRMHQACQTLRASTARRRVFDRASRTLMRFLGGKLPAIFAFSA